jgi:hypothetical protein
MISNIYLLKILYQFFNTTLSWRQKSRATLFLEEVSWRQKARAMWLREWHKNKKKKKKKKTVLRIPIEENNLMDSLVIKGSISSNSAEIKEYIVQFHNQLYSEQFTWRPKVDGLSFLSIDVEE